MTVLPSPATKRWVLIASACASLVALVALRTSWLVPGHPAFDRPWDLHKYLHMAQAPPGDFHIAPFCWRIGLPWLAKLLPLPAVVAMGLWSLVALAATYAITYVTARRIGLDRGAGAIAVVVLVAMGSASKLPVLAMLMPDASALLFTAAATWAVFAARDRAFCILLAVGVCFKESAIFAAALHYGLLAEKPLDLARARRTLLVVAPSVAVLVAIRLVIRPWNDDPSYIAGLPERLWLVQHGSANYDYGRLFVDVGLPRLLHPTLAGLRDNTLGVFGVLPLALIALQLRDLRATLLRVAPFLVLVYAQLLFAVSERRLITLAAPLVALLAARAAQGLAARTRTATIQWLPLPLALLLLLLVDYNAVVARTSHQLAAIGAGATLAAAAHLLVQRFGRQSTAPAAPVSSVPADGSGAR